MKNLRNIFKKTLACISDLIYPPSCAICGKPSDEAICAECATNLTKISYSYCPICGYKLKDDDFFCPMHEEAPLLFVRPSAPFDPVYRELIHELKFYGGVDIANFFGIILGKIIKDEKIFADYHVILPVPLHSRRLKERSYNQSEILAKMASTISEREFLNDCALRIRETEAQTKLGVKERVENVRGAFDIINSDRINGKSIIIIDDVVTTGATTNEIARILKKNGAKNICVVCIAHPIMEDSLKYKI
jgi:ComF family protein